MSQQPPQPLSKPDPNLPELKTKTGKRAERLLLNVWEPLDVLGRGLMGDLWRAVYLSVQDAIALSILLQLPSFIGRVIIGKDFSGFDVCLQENPLGVSRYACFIIITSDFCLWIILAGRIIGRFWVDLRGLEGGNKHGSGKS
ncbi:hypothetical protein IQ223_24405 [Microcystis aeruginosa LEGE 00239]|jgi:hypothetical protein|uniref:hypothetical protein n=1 Tax=Microcystis aeruginosa TaxID=1126 RepID=UPI001882231E|nr:hypothetical protein [Microcystis aeruginosa]MBE9247478.1 hypothetical protein [Microcystis aeruginosa LEGE 00239]